MDEYEKARKEKPKCRCSNCHDTGRFEYEHNGRTLTDPCPSCKGESYVAE